MSVRIEVVTILDLPIEQAFDAHRDMTLHEKTQAIHKEKVVNDATNRLLELSDEVEFEAIHFGIKQRLRARVTHMEKPTFFRDEMLTGTFKSLTHEHHFKELSSNQTETRDILAFSAPFGPLGILAEQLFLRRYMHRLLVEKNTELKRLISGAERP